MGGRYPDMLSAGEANGLIVRGIDHDAVERPAMSSGRREETAYATTVPAGAARAATALATTVAAEPGGGAAGAREVVKGEATTKASAPPPSWLSRAPWERSCRHPQARLLAQPDRVRLFRPAAVRAGGSSRSKDELRDKVYPYLWWHNERAEPFELTTARRRGRPSLARLQTGPIRPGGSHLVRALSRVATFAAQFLRLRAQPAPRARRSPEHGRSA